MTDGSYHPSMCSLQLYPCTKIYWNVALLTYASVLNNTKSHLKRINISIYNTSYFVEEVSIYKNQLFCRGSRRLGIQKLWLFLQCWRGQLRKPWPGDPGKGGQHYKGTEGGYPEYQLPHTDPYIGVGSQTLSPGRRMHRDRNSYSCFRIIGLAWSHPNLL